MPHYYFHTANGGPHIDHDGAELADDATARLQAIRYAGAVMEDDPAILWDGKDFRVEVTDADRRLLFTLIMLAVDATRPDDTLADRI